MKSEMSVVNRFLFLGAPGVGKGTFAKLITAKEGWVHVSLGAAFRQQIAAKTSLGLRIDECVRNGKLVSDDIANEAVRVILEESQNAKGIILDGYPRTVRQARHLIENVDKSFVAINITLEREVAIEKLLGRNTCATCNIEFNTAHIIRGEFDMPAILPNKDTCKLGSEKCSPRLLQRDDDRIEVIQDRLATYDSEVEELLQYFADKKCLKTFAVQKGIKDTEKLFALMASASTSGSGTYGAGTVTL